MADSKHHGRAARRGPAAASPRIAGTRFGSLAEWRAATARADRDAAARLTRSRPLRAARKAGR